MRKSTLFCKREKKRTYCRLANWSAALLVFLTICIVAALMPVSFVWSAGGVSSVLAVPEAHAHNSAGRKGSGRLIAALQQSVNAPVSSSIDELSPDLSSYLSSLGSRVGVAVYDVTRQRFYAFRDMAQFLTASSIKVPIMLAFLSMTESQEREPDDEEMRLLTAMIERSDNDAASELYNDIHGAAGLANYLQQIGVSGLEPKGDTWGYSLITPHTMVNLLTRLQNGTILTARSRAIALRLMQHVEADQRWGVGDTAPSGSIVAMKNGWVPGPDGLWSVNTSGIVSQSGETYIISVYTQGQSSLADGQAIVRRICSAVASALL